MKNVYVLNNKSNILSSIGSKFFLIHCFFTSIHSVLLLGFVCYQFRQPLFLNSRVWVFVYLFLFLSFSIDFIYFYFYEKMKNKATYYWVFLFTDTVLMTVCLSIVIPVLYPVLVFIYMCHIVSAGILGQYKGAFAQGLFVSFLFSWILILNPEGAGAGDSLILSFLLNNVGFMVVAGLSGFFGHQARKMQWSLKAADKVVNELGNLNRVIAENINMGLFLLDKESFIIHSNQVGLDILSLPASFSAPVHTVFPELREHIVSSNKEDIVNRLEVEYQSGNAKKIIEIFISPIVDVENRVNKHLILFQDCTKMRKMEKFVQEKERFASIGRMAAGIAHELRNPLSSIGGSIQLLDVEKKNSAENKRLMDITLREISRLNKIVGDFLDYAKDENISYTIGKNSALNKAKAMESINVNSILEELLDSVRVSPNWEHITHHYTLKSHGLIQGQGDRFTQIFWNIVKNACEAMEHQKKGQLEVETFDDNEWVVIKLKDTGTGIDDEDLSHIYEPFFSKKPKGTGLGMAITRKLVLLFDGDIFYEKRQGGGTICTLRFPIQPNYCPGEMAKRKSA